MSREKPIARLRGSKGTLSLFSGRLEVGGFGRRTKELPLAGLEAKVDGVGMQMRAITLGNVAYLTLTGSGVAHTEELKGRARIRLGVEFAAQVNAAAKAL